MILRKKAISVKENIDSQGNNPNKAPSVFYVVLTSCDKSGRPELPVSFFDVATKRSFKKHDIQFITVHDLVVDFKKSFPNWDGKSDIFLRSGETDHKENQRLANVFEDFCKDLQKGLFANDKNEFIRRLNQNGINYLNAYQEIVKMQQNPNYKMTHLDVYIMLFSFIRRHRNDHIFVDEMSILHSKFCKFYLV